MPRKTKEQNELENEELSTVKTTSTVRKTSSSKKTTSPSKKTSSKSETNKAEKNISSKDVAESKKPKKTVKDVAESENPKKVAKSKKASAESTKKAATKSSAKSSGKIAAKSTEKATSKSASKTTKKSNAITSKKPVGKSDEKSATKTSRKSATTSSTRAKKAASEKKTVAKTTTRDKKAVAEEKVPKKSDIVEYYDLPYRYNQTIVKLLAQTPTNLFVYWDISDADRENFKKQYGYDFFEKTRPILIVHNDTMNYSFEVEINDFANCWYLHVNDSNCDYRIELGRKPVIGYVQNWQPSEEDLKDENSEINKYPSKPIDRDYFYITTSNQLESPNDHILFNKNSAPQSIQIRNVKTNEQYSKPISALSLKNNMHKIYNIYDLYRELYKEENIEDIFDLSNPSSGNPSSKKEF